VGGLRAGACVRVRLCAFSLGFGRIQNPGKHGRRAKARGRAGGVFAPWPRRRRGTGA
jgi:hypothetical protein